MSELKPMPVFDHLPQELETIAFEEIQDFEIVSIACANGAGRKFATAIRKHFNTGLPSPGTYLEFKSGSLLWTGQDQYFLFQHGRDDRIDEKLGSQFDGLAYFTLQTDGWAVLDISGPQVHDLFERFISLDLRRQSNGFGTRTNAHHMSVIILKLEKDKYRLLTPRSSSGSFRDSLVQTARDTIEE